MNTYPTKPPMFLGSTRTTINPTQRSESEAGYIFARKKYTRDKSKYSLNYSSLTYDEFNILNEFFKTNQGEKFYFTHPIENIRKVCVFAMDELVANDDFSGHCSTKVELIEI